MLQSPSNGVPSDAIFRQGDFDQANPAEQPRVRANPSERRSCAAIAKKIAEKISAFFKRIASCFPSWKESPVDATLEEAAKKAASTINDGLVTNDFTKVYKGLKRLYNAEQKFPNEDKNVSTRVKAAIAAAVGEAEKNLREFAEGRDTLVNQHSGRNTLFHQVLEKLEKIGLVPKSYMDSRKGRITVLDDEIKESLQSIQRNYLNEHICPGYERATGKTCTSYEKLIQLGHEDATKKEAIETIAKNAMESGDSFDKYRLALHILYDKINDETCSESYKKKLLQESDDLLQESRDEGCLDAEYYLACNDEYKKIYKGKNLLKSCEIDDFHKEDPSIISAFKKLSEKGHVGAKYKLAKIYANTRSNNAERMSLLTELAEIGHFPSKDDLLVNFKKQIPEMTRRRWLDERHKNKWE